MLSARLERRELGSKNGPEEARCQSCDRMEAGWRRDDFRFPSTSSHSRGNAVKSTRIKREGPAAQTWLLVCDFCLSWEGRNPQVLPEWGCHWVTGYHRGGILGTETERLGGQLGSWRTRFTPTRWFDKYLLSAHCVPGTILGRRYFRKLGLTGPTSRTRSRLTLPFLLSILPISCGFDATAHSTGSDHPLPAGPLTPAAAPSLEFFLFCSHPFLLWSYVLSLSLCLPPSPSLSFSPASLPHVLHTYLQVMGPVFQLPWSCHQQETNRVFVLA